MKYHFREKNSYNTQMLAMYFFLGLASSFKMLLFQRVLWGEGGVLKQKK